MDWDDDDWLDPQSAVGDVVSVDCDDGVRRDLEITEVTPPGIRRLLGDSMHRVWTEDGRQIVYFEGDFDMKSGWHEGVAY